MNPLLTEFPHDFQIAVALVLGVLLAIVVAALAEIIERMED